MTPFFQDLRYGARQLWRSPGFTMAAIVTLALGTGANTAIFSVVRAVLIRELPYRDAGRLVMVGHQHAERGSVFGAFSPQDFEDLRAGTTAYSSLAAYWFQPGNAGRNVTGLGQPMNIEAALVDGALFSTLGVPAVRGRTFAAGDDQPGKNRVVVLSNAFWQSRLGGDPAAIGSTIRLDGDPFTVIGVMPPDFGFPSIEAQAWLPLSFMTDDMTPHRRGVRWLGVVGRLRPGASVAAAASQSSAVIGRLEKDYPESNRGWTRATVMPLQEYLVGDMRPSLLALLAAVGLVLLIACVNVAHLLVARGILRTREIAVRAALGASRARLVSQLLVESALLALLGGMAGLLIAWWTVPVLARSASTLLPRAAEVVVDPIVAGFALTVSLTAFLLFGVMPAFRITELASHPILGEGKGVGSSGSKRLASVLVAAESALAVLLLSGAGLALTSLWKLTHVDPGFRPANVLSFRVSLQGPRYDAGSGRSAFRRNLLERLSELPGVVAVGGSKQALLGGGGEQYTFEVVRGDGTRQEIQPGAGFLMVTPGFFKALDIPLLGGREFSPGDTLSPFPIVVSRALARQAWPDTSALGQVLYIGRSALTVIGVADDVHQQGLAKEAVGAAYVPLTLFPRSSLNVFLRVSDSPLALIDRVREVVHELDPDLPVSDLGPLPAQLERSVAQPRLFTILIGAFGATALALAAVGVYGVVASNMARRRREIGIQIALGAQATQVVRVMVTQAMGWTLAGSVLGFAGFLLAARGLRGLLYGVRPTDPTTLVAASLALLITAGVAAYLPARRAARVDPIVTLREE